MGVGTGSPTLTMPTAADAGPAGSRAGDVLLSAPAGAARVEADRSSSSPYPILLFERALTSPSGSWLCVSYSQSFSSQPTRPLLRFRCRDGAVVDHVMPAAVFGCARWVGPIAPEAMLVEILIFDGAAGQFRIDEIEFVGAAAQLWRLIKRGPGRFLRHCAVSGFYSRRTAERHMQVALECRPLSDFAKFAAAHGRDIEPEGLDRPNEAMTTEAPIIEFLIALPLQSDDEALAHSIGSLERQIDGAWCLRIAVPAGTALSSRKDECLASSRPDQIRIVEFPRSLPRQAALASLVASATGSMICIIEAGDCLAPEATFAIRSFLLNHAPAALYTDSAVTDGKGRPSAPLLKPDWSPEFLLQTDYIGGLCLFDAKLAKDISPSLEVGEGNFGFALLLAISAHVDGGRIHHLRRLLLFRPLPKRPALPEARIASVERHLGRVRPGATVRRKQSGLRINCEPSPRPRVTIIIPTRDRCELLRRAVATVLEKTTYPDYEILVIDNASVERTTLDYLGEMEQAGQFRVVRDGGEFSFSRIVNNAVLHTQSEILVLLNNDIHVIEPGWLDELVALAMLPDVGAVGAKLLYPNGRIQHAGVVIGLFGHCGHFHRNFPEDYVDHLGRLQAVHELSAVTAACLAVRREVWTAAGGFDETFAVDFNDIDFCLRLRRLGLRNLWTPYAVLGHEESASRGDERGKQERFQEEARLFAERWRREIQDDPCFHPSLSLLSAQEMLE
jgi:O-antigen biosynthesis protein